jgi:hypothetical protein
MPLSRKSPQLPAIVAAVAALGVTIDGRALESLSQAELLPPDGTPLDQLAAHVVAASSVYRPGPGAKDRAARILAARGFGCVRYPAVLARSYGASSIEDLASQMKRVRTDAPDPDTDDGSLEIERRAQAVLDAGTGPGPGPALGLLAGLLGDIKRNSDRTPVADPVVEEPTGPRGVPITETSEQTTFSVLEQMYRIVYGGSVTSAESLSRVVEDGAPELDGNQDAALAALVGVESVVVAVLANLGSLPPWVLAGGAQFARVLLASSGVDSLPGVRSQPVNQEREGDEELDQLAAVMAPMGIALAPMIYALGGFDVPPLPSPEDLSALQGPPAITDPEETAP